MEKAPLIHEPIKPVDFRGRRLMGKHGNGCFGIKERLIEGNHAPALTPQENASPLPLHHHHRSPARIQTEAFSLDIRLKGKARNQGRSNTGLNAVTENKAVGLVKNIDLETDTRLFMIAPFPRPKRLHHAALGRYFPRQSPSHGRLDKLQCAIKIGLSNPIGTDENIHPVKLHADGTERAILSGKHGLKQHAATPAGGR